jgi:hypothetical protein
MAKVKDPVWVPLRAVADEVDAAATIQALASGSLSEDALAT